MDTEGHPGDIPFDDDDAKGDEASSSPDSSGSNQSQDDDTPDAAPEEHHLCGDCSKCGKKPVVTEIIVSGGKKIEKQLCQECAEAQGHTKDQGSINKVLTSLMMPGSAGAKTRHGKPKAACPDCGLTFAKFRKDGLLGCPSCYKAFEEPLTPLLMRAHEGGCDHRGKIPSRAGASVERQEKIALLRRKLDEAIRAEQYERAAQVRDELKNIEQMLDQTKSEKPDHTDDA